MNKRDADEWVHHMTAKSLRGLANRLTLKDCPEGTTDAGLAKYKEACTRLANKLADKFPKREPIEHEKEV